MTDTKTELINKASLFSWNNDSPIFEIDSWGTTNKKYQIQYNLLKIWNHFI